MISFLDADDNTLLVRLAPERVQLAVVDSRPIIEGDELRALATALFQTYVGPPLVERLIEADRHLATAAKDGGMTPGQDARIEAARYAIAAVLATVREPPGGAINPCPPARRRLPPGWLAPPASGEAGPANGAAPARTRKPRTFRARDGYPLDWGWTRVAA